MVIRPKQSKGLNVFVVIIAIIFGVLLIGSLLVPKIYDPPIYGRPNITRAQIEGLGIVLAQYYVDTGQYPSTSEGLKALMERPSGPAGAKWNGPYVSKKARFIDGWGRELHYGSPGIHNPDSYDLWSYGGDGKKGEKSLDADIGNWRVRPRLQEWWYNLWHQ